VIRQGYVAASGNASLLYPAVYAARNGTATMVYTITSPTLNPSAAFSRARPAGNRDRGAWLRSALLVLRRAAVQPAPRWGDYSWAAPDPESSQIWMATEYIPPTSEWDGFDNWGTYNLRR